MRKLILIIWILMILPVYSGSFEDALKSNSEVLLYLYSPNCISCKNFTPHYNEVLKTHKNIKGVMVNVETPYGEKLIKKYKGRYIPYLILANNKSNKTVTISAHCLSDSICTERALKAHTNK